MRYKFNGKDGYSVYVEEADLLEGILFNPHNPREGFRCFGFTLKAICELRSEYLRRGGCSSLGTTAEEVKKVFSSDPVPSYPYHSPFDLDFLHVFWAEMGKIRFENNDLRAQVEALTYAHTMELEKVKRQERERIISILFNRSNVDTESLRKILE